MDKLDAKKDGSTMNVVEENIARLKELFPDVFTEGEASQGQSTRTKSIEK